MIPCVMFIYIRHYENLRNYILHLNPEDRYAYHKIIPIKSYPGEVLSDSQNSLRLEEKDCSSSKLA